MNLDSNTCILLLIIIHYNKKKSLILKYADNVCTIFYEFFEFSEF
jgi:hypothetical protein